MLYGTDITLARVGPTTLFIALRWRETHVKGMTEYGSGGLKAGEDLFVNAAETAVGHDSHDVPFA